MQVELLGGPHDGARLSTGLRLPLLWTNGKRCFRKPGPSRALYRETGEVGRPFMRPSGEMAHGSRFRFIGNTHAVCDCGALKVRHRSCPICGANPVTDDA